MSPKVQTISRLIAETLDANEERELAQIIFDRTDAPDQQPPYGTSIHDEPASHIANTDDLDRMEV